MKCRSLWHSPANAVRISTSRRFGLACCTSSMASGWFTSCRTAAFIIWFPPGIGSFPVFLVVRLLVVTLQHDGMVGGEIIGVVQHVGLEVPAMERRIPRMRRHRADHGVRQPE